MNQKRIIKANQREDAKSAALNLADFAEEARGVILDARKDAARIVADARAKADAIQRTAREEAYSEGFARGQNDGYSDGCEQAKRQAVEKHSANYAEVLEFAKKTVAELSDAPEKLLRQASSEVLEIAILLAEKIVGNIAVRDPQAARQNLRKALALADFGGPVCVKVNPEQLETLRETLAGFLEKLDREATVQVLADETVSAGGVVLETPKGKVDASVERQLQNTALALLGEAASRKKPANRQGRYAPTPSNKNTNCPKHTSTHGNL